MSFPKSVKELCPPAMVYFVLSIFAIIIMIFQNLGNRNKFQIGNMSCYVTNTTLLFFVKIIYILFWTYILNLICKDGHQEISWFLVFLPFIWFFLIFLYFALFKM